MTKRGMCVLGGAVLVVALVLCVLSWLAESLSKYGVEEALRDFQSDDDTRVVKAGFWLRSHPQLYDNSVAAVLIDAVREPPGQDFKRTARHNTAVQMLIDHKERAATMVLLDRLFADPGDYTISVALGEIGDERAVQPLIDWLSEQGPRGSNAYLALGTIGGDKAVSFLVKQLAANPTFGELVEALGNTRDPGALEPLMELWPEHKEGALGLTYLIAISKISDEKGLPVLLQMSRDPDAERRAAATAGLGRTHSPKALARLEEMLAQERDSRVRYSIAVALSHDGSEKAVALLTQELDRVWDVILTRMREGQKSVFSEYDEVANIAQALAATRRASALVELMRFVQEIKVLGAQRYVDANVGNEVSAESATIQVFQSIGNLRGSLDLVNARDRRFMYSRDAARLRRTLDVHLTWWKKEGKRIRHLASEEKILPCSTSVPLEDLTQR